MIIVILFFLAIVVGIMYFRSKSQETETKTVVFDEKKIVDKFNKLIRSLTPRNIETVKKDLLDCLQQYKIVKRQQFIDARSLITDSISNIKAEIESISRTIGEKSLALKNNKANMSEYEGARGLYEIDLYKQMKNKLSASIDILDKKLSELDQKIIAFDTQLQLKRTKIITMISSSLAIDDCSSIDLKLDSLEMEFKSEVNKIEQTRIVDEKMGNVKKDSDTLTFDVEHYIKVFKEL